MSRRSLVAILAAAAALSVSTALAAARYDHSTPGPEEVLATAPGRVDVYTRLATSAAPGDTQMIVFDRDKRQVQIGDAVVDPRDHRHFWVALQPDLAPGRYVVTFKTLGESDLDHDGGNFAFYVGVQPTAEDRAADRPLTLTIPSEDVGLTGYRRGIVEGGLTLVIAGPAAFYYVLRRRRKAEQAEGNEDESQPPV